MKIVIIAKQTFPYQGPRAFRVAELSEQFARMGHDVHVYAVLGNYDYSEYFKCTRVHVHNIPMIFAIEDSCGLRRYSVFDKIMFHLFKRIADYPDIEFKYRVGSILKKEKNIDLLITVAVPHAIHWGVSSVKKSLGDKFPKCWISDCGDPFCLTPFIKIPKYFYSIEKKWCRNTDYITVPTATSYKGYFPEFYNKIKVIPQGFDFKKTKILDYSKNAITTFVFVGTIYEGIRDPISFIRYLAGTELEFKFIILTREPVPVVYKELLGNRLDNIVGSTRKECIEKMSQADFLINITNPNTIQTPSKLIDYGLSKRPILDITSPFAQEEVFLEFYNGNYAKAHVIESLDNFNIINVANKFLALYEEKNSTTA